MGVKYLFDSNIIIYFLSGSFLSETALAKLDAICEQGQRISIISKLELLGYRFSDIENEKQTTKFINRSVVYQITPGIEDVVIQLRRNYKIKLPDAIIAATAISNDLTLLSVNTDDFSGITELKLTNPLDW